MPIVNPTFEFETVLWEQGLNIVAGVDEVGAGCLAGPVVTGAVILPREVNIDKLRDSKTLSPAQREKDCFGNKRRSRGLGDWFGYTGGD